MKAGFRTRHGKFIGKRGKGRAFGCLCSPVAADKLRRGGDTISWPWSLLPSGEVEQGQRGAEHGHREAEGEEGRGHVPGVVVLVVVEGLDWTAQGTMSGGRGCPAVPAQRGRRLAAHGRHRGLQGRRGGTRLSKGRGGEVDAASWL